VINVSELFRTARILNDISSFIQVICYSLNSISFYYEIREQHFTYVTEPFIMNVGDLPFKCWICKAACRRKDNLYRHIKNTHKQPKQVAKVLANETAAEYLAKSKQASVAVPASEVNSAVM
jgi:hypothetical protein